MSPQDFHVRGVQRAQRRTPLFIRKHKKIMKNIGKTLGGAVLIALLSVGVAGAQTTTTSGGTTTVGTPNTGMGGDTAMNVLILGSSALVAVAGAAYLRRKNI